MLADAMIAILSAIFAIAAILKLRNADGVYYEILELPMPRLPASIIAKMLAPVEGLTSLGLLVGPRMPFLALAAVLLMLFSAYLVLSAIRRSPSRPCACFGQLQFFGPSRRSALVRNACLMAVVAIAWLA